MLAMRNGTGLQGPNSLKIGRDSATMEKIAARLLPKAETLDLDLDLVLTWTSVPLTRRKLHR